MLDNGPSLGHTQSKVRNRQFIKQYAHNNTFGHHFLDGMEVEVAEMMMKFVDGYRGVDGIGVVGVWQINKS